MKRNLLLAHVLRSDVVALKNPVAHALHWGSVVVVPPTVVYLPGGHLVWAAHESVSLPLDIVGLKNPDLHTSHVAGP